MLERHIIVAPITIDRHHRCDYSCGSLPVVIAPCIAPLLQLLVVLVCDDGELDTHCLQVVGLRDALIID